MLRLLSYILLIPYWIWLILVFLCFLVSSSLIGLILIPTIGKRAHQPMMMVYKFWSATFFFCAGIRIKTINREKLFGNLPCIVVSNHGSNLDMFISAYSLPLSVKPLAKVQLKKMPLLGFLFATVCVLVDRRSKESRDKSSRAMMSEILSGNSIFIFPEGTRNKSQEPLNEFFDGAFRFAIESQKPLVAMCSINARNITPSDNYAVRPGTITIKFLGPYETTGLTKEDLPALKTKIREEMYQVLKTEDPMFKHLL
ncbi:MAG TPA: lysophospholipid acyltransferase family protein [Flavobacteriales bacterium]|nr:lysophospholipid acyltransferase family protein [Flavobacteriales bacterium]